MSNITNLDHGLLMSLASNSEMNMNNVTYADSSMKLIRVFNSKCVISGLRVHNINTQSDSMMTFYSAFDISFTNSNLSHINSQNSKVIEVSTSNFTTIDNLIMNDVNTTVLYMTGSTVDLMNSLKMHNLSQAIFIMQTHITSIIDSNLTMCGFDDTVYGGAIDAIDSSISIKNTQFVDNKAQSGAAVSFRCTHIDSCNINISKSSFINNQASIKGGAIYYDFARPTMTDIVFDNNQAEYGEDIASYAVRIVQVGKMNQNIELSGVASGISLSNSPTSSNQSSLHLVLVDIDDQIMVLVDSSNIKISAIDNSSEVIGTSEVRANDGLAVFDDIGFLYRPGSENISFVVNSTEIDQNKVQHLVLPTNDSIHVSFRY